MKTITDQEIVDFIKAQPDDRPVRMGQCESSNSCGCIMVHYGREVLHIEEPFICGEDIFRIASRPLKRPARLERSIFHFFNNNRTEHDEMLNLTYGSLKRQLKPEFQ